MLNLIIGSLCMRSNIRNALFATLGDKVRAPTEADAPLAKIPYMSLPRLAVNGRLRNHPNGHDFGSSSTPKLASELAVE
jgi:hypothetical protein